MIIQKGKVYIAPMLEGYNKVYEFIEVGLKYEKAEQIRGRLSLVGLYLNYAQRDLPKIQKRFLDDQLKPFCKQKGIDVKWYTDLTT